MFTGIIEEIGTIKKIESGVKSTQLTIQANKILQDLQYGDSVAVDGVCLTVVSLTATSKTNTLHNPPNSKNIFVADVMAQTLRYSTLGNLKIENNVNLERALLPTTRLGGHIVAGHVDCVGTIVSEQKEDIARWVEISLPKEKMKYIIEKGSVCVDGISLTVAELKENTFLVSTIPVTQNDTTLVKKKIGDKVNLELDVLAKYTERLLNFKAEEKNTKTNLDENFLQQHGFI